MLKINECRYLVKGPNMNIKFEKQAGNFCLIVTAEGKDEATQLQRWDNCIITLKFDYDYSEKPSRATLTLIKKI